MISLQRLRRYPYFASANEDVLRRIAGFSAEHFVEPDEVLFREGDHASHVYVLIEGRVDILFKTRNEEVCIVDTLVPGDLMSWSGLLPPHRATGSCMARVRSEVLMMRADDLRELCEQHPEFGYGFMKEIATTLRNRLRGARVQLAVRA
jgi:CRP-like cAMP-binding protein